MDTLQPHGVAVVVEAFHLCMMMAGGGEAERQGGHLGDAGCSAPGIRRGWSSSS